MGEARRRALAVRQGAGQGPDEPQVVDTLGGRMHVRWDEGAAATPHGQLVFFAEFLAATGVFERWVSTCPLSYRSGNAPDKRDVLGTLMLGLLAGHRRYAHIAALRGDAVAAQALGMAKVVSEDALRRALERIDEAASAAWMRPSLMHSVREALDRPWVLDIDASIKPLYGRQEGAELGYNPAKPMRPSHVLHTFLVSNLRLVLDVQVSSGKQHTSGHAKAALGQLLDELGDKRPALVRGDSGYGNEGILVTLEQRQQPYLLRLRQTKNVQRLVAQQFARQDWSRPDSQGCQMVEAQLQLHGWSTKRRVIIVRQRIRGGIARERRVDGKQLRLDLAGPSVHEGDKLWEYAVLVTDVAYPLESIGQLYRDRADAENAFDELKNQWGLGGFTTQDINRCQTVARACALVYNWWSWYCRAAHPTGRLEAITSRPLLLAAVGKAASHANQTTLYLLQLFIGLDGDHPAVWSRRHDPQRVEQPTAHAQEPDVQSQAELVGVTSACVDQRTLSRAEGEESLQLEAADVTWQLAHAKVRGLPALHRVASLEWTMHDTSRKSEQQSQSDQQLTNLWSPA